MADFESMERAVGQQKSFWQKPEGITGVIFLLAILAGVGFLAVSLPWVDILANTLYMAGVIIALAAIVYMVLDPKMRALVSYMYKSAMRSITSLFVTIDPIGILKNYIDDLKSNLSKMSKQIGGLKGQIRKLSNTMEANSKEIENNMKIASAAKRKGNDQAMLLASRKASRLQETNKKYQALHGKMNILYRVLTKMYQNSEVLLADTEDQVKLKEQERKAIRASHSAMKSAMSIISGDKDKRAMFDMAMEAVADDVANKVGEMERFMEMSANFMDSIDLQNGIFEEEGLKMLEKWEKESTLMLMEGNSPQSLDLNAPRAERQTNNGSSSSGNYENLFD